MKSAHDERYKERGKSLPWRGVWVEINIPMGDLLTAPCHSLGGECGLKYLFTLTFSNFLSHSLGGECGLKLPTHRLARIFAGHSLGGECGLKFLFKSVSLRF